MDKKRCIWTKNASLGHLWIFRVLSWIKKMPAKKKKKVKFQRFSIFGSQINPYIIYMANFMEVEKDIIKDIYREKRHQNQKIHQIRDAGNITRN
jgi:hypothetical protein